MLEAEAWLCRVVRPTSEVAMGKDYTHYKTFCISMYNGDASRLDQIVAELKRRGQKHASRSSVIRYALGLLSMDDIQLPPPRWWRKTRRSP